jgi:hypothetical protein
MVETIKYSSKILAIIVSGKFNQDGLHFFTPDEFSQQLAFMRYPKGKRIEPHLHNTVKREVLYTNEVLVLRKGKLRVDFYNDDKVYITSRMLVDGDVILLVSGGHGFEVEEDVEMFEIKQGPFIKDKDKVRFVHYPEK